MKLFRNIFCVAVLGVGLLSSCSNIEAGLGENPYAGGKEQLGISFQNLNRPIPSARVNDIITLSVKGLKSTDRNSNTIEAFVNNEKAEILGYTDSTLDLRIPALVSSGSVKIKIDDQVFYGPRIPIEGKVTFDSDYGASVGFNNAVGQILPVNNNFWVVGAFTNFQNQASNTVFRNGIHLLNTGGETVTTTDIKKGATGSISSITPLSDGKLYIAGLLGSYNNHEVRGITRVLQNGALDTVRIEVANSDLTDISKSFDTLPAFNAQVYGNIYKLFTAENNSVIALGNITTHSYIDYNYSSRETKHYVFTKVKDIIKIRADGRLDSSFNVNNTGLNGYINGAVQLTDGKIVVVGAFTSYNGQSANRILALDPDGKISTSFATGVGADDEILSITYNPVKNKIALAGRFKNFNASGKSGVVILNGDGSVDNSFTLRSVDQKIPNYAYFTNNNKVLVTGNFVKYDGINRSQLLILETTGEAKQEYNNIGTFSGWINSVVETNSSMGYPALLIGGGITMADDKKVGNIFRLEIRN